MKTKDKLDYIKEKNPKALVADGFDKAIIGIVDRIGMGEVVLYETNKCIAILIAKGMSEEEAIDYFYYNVMGSYVGEYTPCFAEIL